MDHQLLVGKYTLESLTSGLYVSPLDLFREYVQNAADSIDQAVQDHIINECTKNRKIKNKVDKRIK